MQLDPEPGIVLIRDFNLNTNVLEQILAIGHDTFIGWEWRITPERDDSIVPDELVVIESNEILTVGWKDEVTKLFPTILVKYLINGTTSIVKTLEEVPKDAQLIKYVAHPLNERNYNLYVKDTGLQLASSGPVPIMIEGNYTITILQQHNRRRDQMINVVKDGKKQNHSTN